MEISHRSRPVSLLSTKQMARQEAQRDVVRQGDTHNTDAQRTDDASPVGKVQRFVQSTDEMSAAMTQFRNRRDLEKKSDQLSGSFERVLEEDTLPKVKEIIQLARIQKLSPEELLKLSRALFPDDSDLALVLRELLRRMKLAEVVTKRIQFLLKEVESQSDPKVLKAGINCALKARLFGKALELRPGLLRASYRQFLSSEEPEIEVYADWIGNYGYQRRALVLDFIESALVTDINSLDASCSRMEFGYLLGRLSQLKLLRSADMLFVNRLLANTIVQTFNKNEGDWLLLMLSLLQQPSELDTLLAETVGGQALFSRHYEHSSLLYVLYLTCKTLPPVLFADNRGRETMLENLREMASTSHKNEKIELRRQTENIFLLPINLEE